MTDSANFRLALKLAPAVLAAALVAAPGSASADTSSGDAFGICRQKVRETFGEESKTKLKRIKERGSYFVEIKVTGVSEKPFVAKCEVARDGTLSSFEHDGPAK
jgi:hypothetical protein